MNGISKKLCMTVVAITAVAKLAEGASDKWPYAIVIGCIYLAYEAVQGFIDSSKPLRKDEK